MTVLRGVRPHTAAVSGRRPVRTGAFLEMCGVSVIVAFVLFGIVAAAAVVLAGLYTTALTPVLRIFGVDVG